MLNVHVRFRSGLKMHFVVPSTITVVEFTARARVIDASGIKTCVIVVPESRQ